VKIQTARGTNLAVSVHLGTSLRYVDQVPKCPKVVHIGLDHVSPRSSRRRTSSPLCGQSTNLYVHGILHRCIPRRVQLTVYCPHGSLRAGTRWSYASTNSRASCKQSKGIDPRFCHSSYTGAQSCPPRHDLCPPYCREVCHEARSARYTMGQSNLQFNKRGRRKPKPGHYQVTSGCLQLVHSCLRPLRFWPTDRLSETAPEATQTSPGRNCRPEPIPLRPKSSNSWRSHCTALGRRSTPTCCQASKVDKASANVDATT
jgi:hypothetical protein